ncbi:MAG: hypothetical protein HC782_04075 [Gammaproteobacteria bacterium]|nr:hypothetical protein [Gammaproteobacteria bacterium]
MASTLVLTQVYLESTQKKALAKAATKTGRSVSDLMRDGADAIVAGITMDDLNILDEGTKRAKVDIDAMVSVLANNTKEHNAFMRKIAALNKAQ